MPYIKKENKDKIVKESSNAFINTNRDKWNEYQNEYRKNHKPMYNKARMRHYYFNVEAKRLMNILLN